MTTFRTWELEQAMEWESGYDREIASFVDSPTDVCSVSGGHKGLSSGRKFSVISTL